MKNVYQIAGLAVAAAAACIFGMVIAGGIPLTLPTVAQVTPTAAERGLPSGMPIVAIPSFADIAEYVVPAVVGVTATEIFESREQRRYQNPFEFFFRDAPRDRNNEPRGPERRDSGGSGFLISPDGYVLTNYHVVEDADRITVRLHDDAVDGITSDFDAEVVGVDPSTDLALLKIESNQKFPYLELGDSDFLRVGDWVLAVGNPIVYDQTVTVGVVSAKGRRLQELSRDVSLDDYIQTDAAINFGNSGGPLLNIRGEVIGVNTAISVAGQGIGFAVPINIAKGILNQLKSDGRVARGYLGIELAPVTEELKEGFGLPSVQGALVNQVVPGLPAEDAGIRKGDVIISINGDDVATTDQLVQVISEKRPGERVKIEVIRRGEEKVFTAKLADRSESLPGAQVAQRREPESEEVLGISVGELTAEIRRALDLDGTDIDGVVVTDVSPTSEAYEKGIAEGEVITEVNQNPIRSVEDFMEEIDNARDRNLVVLYVVGARGSRFVTIRLQQDN